MIEDWLTSADERAYEIAFSQLLAAEGHQVLHISTHGMMEQGKDIITKSPSGFPCGFQLKSGDVTLSVWRKIKGEIDDLIELPIVHPGLPNQKRRRAILVTSGFLSDPVRRAIDDRNRESARRRLRFPRLEVVTKGELIRRFVAIHGAFFPSSLTDFGLFLRLLAVNPKDVLPKAAFAAFLKSVLPLRDDSTGRQKARDVALALSSTLILSSYILGRYQKVKNWLALLEGWTLVAAHIGAAAERFHLASDRYRFSLGLCKLEIVGCLQALGQELLGRRHFGEGNLLAEDPVIYRTRLTILIGWISAGIVATALEGENVGQSHEILEVLSGTPVKPLLWGEGAVPFFVTWAWALERAGKSALAESLLASAVQAVCTRNGPKSQAPLPSPWEPTQESLARDIGLPTKQTARSDAGVGYSYSLETLVDMLARRLRRQLIRQLWPGITYVSFAKFEPDQSWQFLRWKNRTGMLKIDLPKKPQSWAELLDRASNRGVAPVPAVLRSNLWLTPYFLLTYPHRFGPEIAALIDGVLGHTP